MGKIVMVVALVATSLLAKEPDLKSLAGTWHGEVDGDKALVILKAEEVFDYVIDSFGIDRCLVASNFPVDKLFGSYDKIFNAYKKVLEKYSDEENNKFEVSNYIPYTRAVTLFTKEPETIAWIDDRVLPGDVFYDIGANIGVFSLYSAKVKKATVIAFEPHAKNYGILNENIFLNYARQNQLPLQALNHNLKEMQQFQIYIIFRPLKRQRNI